jgi:hypothetical protein
MEYLFYEGGGVGIIKYAKICVMYALKKLYKNN